MNKKDIQTLEKIKKDILENNINCYSVDFCECYDKTNINYLCDAFCEFADNNTSVYYYDQRNYYNEHSQECENALINCGYDLNDLLKECGSLDGVICKAGAIGEYEAILNALYNDEDEIKQLLAINYILDNFEMIKRQYKNINDAIDDVVSDIR